MRWGGNAAGCAWACRRRFTQPHSPTQRAHACICMLLAWWHERARTHVHIMHLHGLYNFRNDRCLSNGCIPQGWQMACTVYPAHYGAPRASVVCALHRECARSLAGGACSSTRTLSNGRLLGVPCSFVACRAAAIFCTASCLVGAHTMSLPSRES